MSNVHFSSKTNEWCTPQKFFDDLNEEFGFTVDVCATEENAKCEKYYTKEQDGLLQDWEGEIVWCNPPYGREIKDWIKKAYVTIENCCVNTTIVMLIPSRTDTTYWHDYVMKASDIRFIRGRIKFGDGKNSAPFPSAVVVFEKVI